MSHSRSPRREHHQVDATLAHEAKLVGLYAVADLVVADRLKGRLREARIAGPFELRRPETAELRWLGRVVAVTVDDHHRSPTST